MNSRRRHRLATALLALAGMLFQQFAMAAYVCRFEQAALRGEPERDAMPCHDERSDRSRCVEHCHPTAASAAHAPLPQVPPCDIAPADLLHAVAHASQPPSVAIARAPVPHATYPPPCCRTSPLLI